MAYRQALERAHLSIEQGTEGVPDDGKYYVLHDGSVKGSFRSLKGAERKYREILHSLSLPPREGPTPEERNAAQARFLALAAVDKAESEVFGAARLKRTKRSRSRTYG